MKVNIPENLRVWAKNYSEAYAKEYVKHYWISFEEGRAEGIISTLFGLVKDGILSLSDAAKRAGMSVAEFEEKSAKLALQ